MTPQVSTKSIFCHIGYLMTISEYPCYLKTENIFLKCDPVKIYNVLNFEFSAILLLKLKQHKIAEMILRLTYLAVILTGGIYAFQGRLQYLVVPFFVC